MNELEKQIEEKATNWVFEENGHRWSNNDDSAGDNTESFKAGANFILEKNLPVLFADWKEENENEEALHDLFFESNQEIYDFWLNNVPL